LIQDFGTGTGRKETTWKCRRRWEYDVRMYLTGTGLQGMERIHLSSARDKWWDAVNFRVPENAGNFLTSRVTTGLSKRTLLHGGSVPQVRDTMCHRWDEQWAQNGRSVAVPKIEDRVQASSPSGHCMYRQFNTNNSTSCPHRCIYVFCVDLRTNSDYFPIQH